MIYGTRLASQSKSVKDLYKDLDEWPIDVSAITLGNLSGVAKTAWQHCTNANLDYINGEYIAQITSNQNTQILRKQLSTPHKISLDSDARSINLTNGVQSSTAHAIFSSRTHVSACYGNYGVKLYVLDTAKKIREYTQASGQSPHDIQANNSVFGSTHTNENTSLTSEVGTPSDMKVDPFGLRLYVMFHNPGKLLTFIFRTPWDLSTLELDSTFTYPYSASSCFSCEVGVSGRYMYTLRGDSAGVSSGADKFQMKRFKMDQRFDFTNAIDDSSTLNLPVTDVKQISHFDSQSFMVLTGTDSGDAKVARFTYNTSDASKVQPFSFDDIKLDEGNIFPRSDLIRLTSQTDDTFGDNVIEDSSQSKPICFYDSDLFVADPALASTGIGTLVNKSGTMHSSYFPTTLELGKNGEKLYTAFNTSNHRTGQWHSSSPSSANDVQSDSGGFPYIFQYNLDEPYNLSTIDSGGTKYLSLRPYGMSSMSQESMWNDWKRFSHLNDAQPANSSHLNTWVRSEGGRVINGTPTLNPYESAPYNHPAHYYPGVWTGFTSPAMTDIHTPGATLNYNMNTITGLVTPYKLKNYKFSATLLPTGAGSYGAAGLCMAYHEDASGHQHTLSLMQSAGGVGTAAGTVGGYTNGTMFIVYNYGQTTAKNIGPVITNTNMHNSWNNIQNTYGAIGFVYEKHNGIITWMTGNVSGDDYVGQIDLGSDPDLHKFIEKTHFGFTEFRAAGMRWYDFNVDNQYVISNYEYEQQINDIVFKDDGTRMYVCTADIRRGARTAITDNYYGTNTSDHYQTSILQFDLATPFEIDTAEYAGAFGTNVPWASIYSSLHSRATFALGKSPHNCQEYDRTNGANYDNLIQHGFCFGGVNRGSRLWYWSGTSPLSTSLRYYDLEENWDITTAVPGSSASPGAKGIAGSVISLAAGSPEGNTKLAWSGLGDRLYSLGSYGGATSYEGAVGTLMQGNERLGTVDGATGTTALNRRSPYGEYAPTAFGKNFSQFVQHDRVSQTTQTHAQVIFSNPSETNAAFGFGRLRKYKSAAYAPIAISEIKQPLRSKYYEFWTTGYTTGADPGYSQVFTALEDSYVTIAAITQGGIGQANHSSGAGGNLSYISNMAISAGTVISTKHYTNAYVKIENNAAGRNGVIRSGATMPTSLTGASTNFGVKTGGAGAAWRYIDFTGTDRQWASFTSPPAGNGWFHQPGGGAGARFGTDPAGDGQGRYEQQITATGPYTGQYALTSFGGGNGGGAAASTTGQTSFGIGGSGNDLKGGYPVPGGSNSHSGGSFGGGTAPRTPGQGIQQGSSGASRIMVFPLSGQRLYASSSQTSAAGNVNIGNIIGNYFLNEGYN